MLTEFTPPHARARWQGMLARLSNLGIKMPALLCAAVLPLFGWRPVFALIGTLAILVWTPRRLIPESPRWYESRGLNVEAEKTVGRIEREVESCIGFSASAVCGKIRNGRKRLPRSREEDRTFADFSDTVVC